MKHPNLPKAPPAEVQTESFLSAWRYRGWVEADPPVEEEFIPAPAEPEADAGKAPSKKAAEEK